MKAVIFDWDGTLVDTCALVLEAHNHVRAHYGLPLWSEHDLFGKSSQSARECYPEIYKDQAEAALERLYGFMQSRHLDHLTEITGAGALIQKLHASDIPMGVVSNKRHDLLLREVSHIGWDHYFKTVIGAGHALKDKPAADPLHLALDRMQAREDIDSVYYVGDTETDLACAKAGGCPAIYVSHGKDSQELAGKYQPVFIANDLSVLEEYLMKLLDAQNDKLQKKAC